MLSQRQCWLQVTLGVFAACLFLCIGVMPVWADHSLSDRSILDAMADQPAQLFALHCVGCHPHGGNIIRRGKTLKARSLKRYGYEDVGSIAAIIASGKGVMSAYQDRLTSAEIDALADYVWKQAETGWKD